MNEGHAGGVCEEITRAHGSHSGHFGMMIVVAVVVLVVVMMMMGMVGEEWCPTGVNPRK